MSVGSDLIAALASTTLPVELDNYAGTASSYITINYNTIPDLFASDAPQFERYLIQVHLTTLATTNVTTLITTIKNALVAAGYSYPSMINASENVSERHLVFETETAVYIG